MSKIISLQIIGCKKAINLNTKTLKVTEEVIDI